MAITLTKDQAKSIKLGEVAIKLPRDLDDNEQLRIFLVNLIDEIADLKTRLNQHDKMFEVVPTPP